MDATDSLVSEIFNGHLQVWGVWGELGTLVSVLMTLWGPKEFH